MEDNKSLQVINNLPETIEKVATEVRDQYPELVKSAETAVLHMSKIQSITSQDDYDKANKLLVKVKATYDKIKTARESWTKPLDAFKKQVMEPEKLVSLLDSHSDSEGNRIKRLMNGFANEQMRIKREKEQEIQRKQNIESERALVEGRVIANIHTQISKKIEEIDKGMEKFFQSITLDNFAEKSKAIKVTPKLKQDYYESLFVVDYDRSKLPVDEFKKEIDRVMSDLPYEGVNDIYVEKANPVVKVWIDKLPGLKKQLKEVADLQEKDALAAAELKKQQQQREEFEANQRREKLAADAKKESDDAQREANIKAQDAVFEAQVESQSIEKVSGVRTKRVAVIDADDEQIVTVIAKMIYANFTSPGFVDYIKRDKDGARMIVDDIPVYENWLQELLDHHAKYCEIPSDGIRFVEVAKATVRKK